MRSTVYVHSLDEEHLFLEPLRDIDTIIKLSDGAGDCVILAIMRVP